ncbi:MAG: hypothetical protein OHK0022_18230 [Roseiflexaceae bacterium]
MRQLMQRWLRPIMLAVFALTLLGALPVATQAASVSSDTRAAVSTPSTQNKRQPPDATTEAWRYICGQTVTLRWSPEAGSPSKATLYYGYSFYENHRSGAWSYGYAPSVGQWGWVLTQYICG